MKNKKVREKGKIRLSDYFKKLKEGDTVTVIKEQTVESYFPRRIIGKSGKIMGKRGSHAIVELRDGNKTKTFIIKPIHLKKLVQSK